MASMRSASSSTSVPRPGRRRRSSAASAAPRRRPSRSACARTAASDALCEAHVRRVRARNVCLQLLYVLRRSMYYALYDTLYSVPCLRDLPRRGRHKPAGVQHRVWRVGLEETLYLHNLPVRGHHDPVGVPQRIAGFQILGFRGKAISCATGVQLAGELVSWLACSGKLEGLGA